MKTEKEKMLAGELYNSHDEQLTLERTQARILFKKLNALDEENKKERNRIIKQLIPNAGKDIWLEAPFYCDYGTNITLGDKVFFNFNCVILDVMEVKIGSRTMLGPGVQINTATHPVDHKERASGLEFAKPVAIGEDVWIGGSAIICPGVSIGDRSVIGAGSVVIKDIPADVIAAGNPCKVIREL